MVDIAQFNVIVDDLQFNVMVDYLPGYSSAISALSRGFVGLLRCKC